MVYERVEHVFGRDHITANQQFGLAHLCPSGGGSGSEVGRHVSIFSAIRRHYSSPIANNNNVDTEWRRISNEIVYY